MKGKLWLYKLLINNKINHIKLEEQRELVEVKGGGGGVFKSYFDYRFFFAAFVIIDYSSFSRSKLDRNTL